MPAGVATRLKGQVHRESARINLYLFWTQANKFKDHYQNLWDDANRQVNSLIGYVDASSGRHFIERLERVSPTLLRTRRGLINFVGDIASNLFGVATEGQINEVQNAILSVDSKIHQISAKTNDIIIAINSTREYQKEMSIHLNNVVDRVNNMAGELSVHFNLLMEEAQKSRYLLTMEMILSELEGVYALVRNEENRQQRALHSAEAGHLTDEIVSPDDLFDILHRHPGTYVQMQLEWYYVNARVSWMPRDNNDFVFVIELPLVSPEIYLAYDINSYPVIIKDRAIRLEVYESVVIGTQTGDMYLTRCANDLCQGGVRFKDTSSQCELSILRKKNPMSFCPIEKFENVFNSVHVIDSSTFVIVAINPIKYNFRCEAEISKEGTFATGTWLINIQGQCLLETDNWKLEGIAVSNENYTLSWDVLPFKVHFDIVNSNLNAVFPSFENLSHVHTMDINQLTPLPHLYWTTFRRHSYVMYIILSIVFVMLVCITFYILYAKFGKRCRRTPTTYQPTEAPREDNDATQPKAAEVLVHVNKPPRLWPTFAHSLNQEEHPMAPV